MAAPEPKTELDTRFSDEGATATEWSAARDLLDRAELFWLSTVRPDGRPHVTPLIAVVLDDALYFCTGPTEQKAANLEHNRHCVLTTGCNDLRAGLDVVIEGDAVPVHDESALHARRRRLRGEVRQRLALRRR